MSVHTNRAKYARPCVSAPIYQNGMEFELRINVHHFLKNYRHFKKGFFWYLLLKRLNDSTKKRFSSLM
jgi:hypothetical protein